MTGRMADGMKILVADIETKPHVVLSWGLFNQNIGINQIVEPGGVICFAAKWYGDRKMHFHSDHHDGHEAMVRRAWELLDEADALVSYNGARFDVPHLHREFELLGLGPPSPHHDIDLLRTARRSFRFPSNKLDWVAQELGLGGKDKTGGMDLWIGCMAGDEKSWAKMARYNRRDVKITEDAYTRLLPWIHNHPHHGLFDDKLRTTCQRCGSNDLIRRGYLTTQLGRFQRFQCNDCGGYSRSGHADRRMNLRAA